MTGDRSKERKYQKGHRSIEGNLGNMTMRLAMCRENAGHAASLKAVYTNATGDCIDFNRRRPMTSKLY